jgi:hypothetical protein
MGAHVGRSRTPDPEPEMPPLLARLADGRELPVESCHCHHCASEWFMAALSVEWMPNFCPYCGIKFIGRTVFDEPAPYKPAD